MTTDKAKKIAVKVAVTFIEGAIAYVSVQPNHTLNKTLLIGAVAAGVSAVYNLSKHYAYDVK